MYGTSNHENLTPQQLKLLMANLTTQHLNRMLRDQLRRTELRLHADRDTPFYVPHPGIAINIYVRYLAIRLCKDLETLVEALIIVKRLSETFPLGATTIYMIFALSLIHI